MGRQQRSVRVNARTAAVDESYVTARSQRIRVQRRNIGNRYPLILINGIGAAIEMWQPFIDHFDDRELICLELPGCGQSPAPLLPMGMPEIAALITDVMDSLGLQRADILGYSFGGAMMLSPVRYYNRRAGELIVPLIAGGQTARDAAQMRSGVARRLAHPPSMRGYAYQLLAISTFTAWPWLHRVPHRTLVVHGRDDPVSPSLNARLMTATMPNARLHTIAGAGHLMLLDEPTRAAPVIVEFLESGSPAVGVR
jgi:pimeloyl-ACP methyl ester carboxylesterase